MPLKDWLNPFWLLLGGYLLLGVGYSVTTPLLETPDEIWHYFYVREVAMRHGLPVQVLPGGGPWAQEGSQPPLYYLLSAAVTTWVDAKDYESLIRRNPHAAFDELTPDNRNIYLHGRAEYFPWDGAPLAMHLARLVSVACGALAVAATYLLARTLFPARRDWAVGGAAFVAFLPQFDFIAGAVSNDSLVTALCAIGLLLCVRVWRDSAILPAIGLGLCIGLAALTKSSGMLLYPLVAGLLALDGIWRYAASSRAHAGAEGYVLCGGAFAPRRAKSAGIGCRPSARRRDVNRGRQIIAVTLVTVGMSGWWFARNQFLYGDWLGVDTHLRIFGARDTPLGLEGFLQQLPEIEISFWGLFGWGNVPLPQLIYDSYQTLALLAGFGVLVWLSFGLSDRAKRPLAVRPQALAMLMLICWIALVFLSFYRWMTLVNAPHGRLLFPALPAIAIFAFVGISWFVPARFRSLWSGAWAVLFFLVSMYSLTQVLTAAFPSPDIVAEQSVPHASDSMPLNLSDLVHLDAVVIPFHVVHRGDQVNVVLYWHPVAPVDKDYTVTLQLFAAGGGRIAQLDTYPARGMYPTSQWLAGQWLRDIYPLRIALDAPGGAATLIVGMYDHTTGKALQVIQPDGRRTGRATVAEFEIH